MPMRHKNGSVRQAIVAFTDKGFSSDTEKPRFTGYKKKGTGMKQEPISPMRLRFKGVAVKTIEAIGDFTGGREPDEVVADALKMYLWILHQQTFDKKIICVNGDPEDKYEVKSLINDKEAAMKFFNKTLKW